MPKLGVADRDAQQSLASDGLRPPMKQTIVGVAPAEREVISAGPASCHTPSVRRCQNGIVPGPFRARGAELLQQLPELLRRRIPPAAIRRAAGARGAEFAPAVGKHFGHKSGAPHRSWMRT